MLAAQDGRCVICGVALLLIRTGRYAHPYTPCVDHDHRSRKVRGLLCRRCNIAIGFFDHSPARMRAAAEYIERTTTILDVLGVDVDEQASVERDARKLEDDVLRFREAQQDNEDGQSIGNVMLAEVKNEPYTSQITDEIRDSVDKLLAEYRTVDEEDL